VAKTAGSEANATDEAGASAGSGQARVHGEGIGLAIVHQLCALHEAVLDVDSEPGGGTTFRVQLPLNPKEIEKPEPDLAPEG
jgi:signal transduction histidine kinase